MADPPTPTEDLRNCSKVVNVDLEVDQQATRSLVEVIQQAYGPYEGNRLIAHLMKDSSSTVKPDRCPSRWLSGACRESLESMANKEDWDCAHQKSFGRV